MIAVPYEQAIIDCAIGSLGQGAKLDTKPGITLVRGGDVWTGGDHPTLHKKSDLVIADGVVVEIAEGFRGEVDVEIDATGCVVIPGLINAHVHSGCTPHIRGIAEDQPVPEHGAFYHTLNSLLALGFRSFSHEEMSALLQWDVAAMLLGGATTIVEESFVAHQAWIDLCGQVGFRGQIGLTYPGSFGSIGYMRDGKIVVDSGGDVARGLEAGMALHSEWDGAFGGRLGVHLSPHGPDTVPEEILRETARISQETGIGVHLHLAQHLNERETVAARSGGKSSVAYLNDIGFLSPRVMAMHTTFLDPGDAGILARSGCTAVHGAYRKAKEALTSPFWDLAEDGVNVAVATDSFAHDLVQDIRFAAMLGRIRLGRSDRPSAEQALSAATSGAARGLGRKDLGHLNPGARGDAVVIDLTHPFAAPVYDAIRSVVYYASARDIRTTLVEGRPIVESGQIKGLDLSDLAERASSAAQEIWRRGEAEGILSPTDNSGHHRTGFGTCPCQ